MTMLKKDVQFAAIAAVAALLITSGCASTMPNGAAPGTNAAAPAMSAMPTVPAATASTTMLTGTQEVPPNASLASARSTVMVGPDKMVTGMIIVSGMTPTMAHIHEASKGMNGPVIMPFVKSGENTFAPAPGAKLTDAQYASYLASKLYLNVHSSTYPGGEVRLQLAPAQ